MLWPDEKITLALNDPDHIAHKNTTRQTAAQKMYRTKFREAEARVDKSGGHIRGGFSEVLGSAASRIFACFSRLGCMPEQDENWTREMVRLAFNFDDEKAKLYLEQTSRKLV